MQNQQNDTPFQETQPLVTFIVTYYNLPPSMLCQCIDSLKALSLNPEEREIIIVDDGSEVSPMEALKDYENDIIYLRKSNGGVSSARNMGVRTATGQYIQFVDGDDWLIKPAYEHCLDLIRNGKNDIVLYDFSLTTEVPVTYEDSEPQSGSNLMRNENIHGSACTCIFRKNILGNLTFTPGITYGEDEEFTPQLLLRADQVVRTTAKAYYYRRREASITTENDMKWVMRRLNDLQGVLFRMADSTDTLPIEEREALERRVCQLTMDYIYNIITLTHNYRYLEKCVEQLTEKGLFPLPDRNYTQKYQWFRRMTGSAWQRRLLCIILK